MLESLGHAKKKKKSHWELDEADIATQVKHGFLLRTDESQSQSESMSKIDKTYLLFQLKCTAIKSTIYIYIYSNSTFYKK